MRGRPHEENVALRAPRPFRSKCIREAKKKKGRFEGGGQIRGILP